MSHELRNKYNSMWQQISKLNEHLKNIKSKCFKCMFLNLELQQTHLAIDFLLFIFA